MNTPPEDPSQPSYLQASDYGNNSPSQGSVRNPRTCLVCGAPASVKNFGILTCESCKAFFRRNAPRGVDAYECTYSGDCEITVVTRKFCQKCRLMKCFSVGMDSTKIESGEQRMRRKEKLVEKKRMRVQIQDFLSSIAQGPIAHPIIAQFPFQVQYGLTDEMGKTSNKMLQVLQTENQTSDTCKCTCSCGKYQPGVPIVEQIEEE